MTENTNYLQQEIDKLQKEISGNEELLKNEADSQLQSLIKEEIQQLTTQVNALRESIDTVSSVISEKKANTDTRGEIDINPNIVIVEIRSGTGGDEAGLFAADLYRMYSRYAEVNNWKVSEVFRSENEAGGIKTLVAEFRGQNVFNLLKNESGVHRVQRIPVTESGGRIHTSTATVAVLPELKKVNIEIKPEELKWDFFRAGGHGGQNVNKVSTAVRLTHIPTQIVIECQEERSQGKNRDKALGILQSKLYNLMQEQQVQNISELRLNQVGTGDRSEKIRTYNYPQSRVTDHRTETSWYGIENIMGGSIGQILENNLKIDENSIPSELPQE
ncbi:PCRF domain-containing protein [candidate division WWE3 bacterium]|jgi:peptide chain release factor 1|uniref:PCRF domain-containing protein n=1 Tax=candidate division WWE3 bacterium TaxID=2053526 RepID=A0A3A4ZDL2_UNCKA|nr:MAG: PCRF domain-containing protein [candidate division WWE3 bacterium]